MPKPEVDSSSPDIGLRIGTAASVLVSRSICPRACRMRIQLAVERRDVQRVGRHERAAGRARRQRRRDLADIEPEIGEHVAHAARLGVVALLERVQALGLAGFEAVERGLQPRERALDAGLGLQRGEHGCRN